MYNKSLVLPLVNSCELLALLSVCAVVEDTTFPLTDAIQRALGQKQSGTFFLFTACIVSP